VADLGIDQLNELAGQYIINNPYVYASSIPNGVNSAYPYFQQLVKLTKKQERDVSVRIRNLFFSLSKFIIYCVLYYIILI
jgi:hypothetical protein